MQELLKGAFVDFPTLGNAFESQRPRICNDDRPIAARGCLEVEEHVIALSENLGEGEMLAIMVHELRHLDRLDRSKRLPAYQLLPDDFLQSLCLLPDGTKYPCADPEELLR